MRKRSDILAQQSAAFKEILEKWESVIDAALDTVSEDDPLPRCFDIHEDSEAHPLLSDVLADKYRVEGGFMVEVGYNDDNRMEIELE